MIDPRVQDLLDREDIRRLAQYYMRGQDRLDPVLHRSVFWDDAYCDYGIFRGDADGFIAFAQGALGNMEASHHLIGQHIIEIDGDEAFGEVYFTAWHRFHDPSGNPADLIVAGRYVDRYERRDSRWKIAYRTEVADWSTTTPANDDFFEQYPDQIRGARGVDDISSQRDKLRAPGG